MAIDLLRYLLEIVAGVLGGAALLRAYLNYQRIPMGLPPARLVFALTDWAVLPLRRVTPKGGRMDWASLLMVAIVLGIQHAIFLLLGGGRFGMWPVMLCFGAVQLAIHLMTLLLVVYAVGSWFRMDPQIYTWLARACEPLLAPVRRLLPTIGGIDFSPMVVVLLAQLLGRALSHWQSEVITGVFLGV